VALGKKAARRFLQHLLLVIQGKVHGSLWSVFRQAKHLLGNDVALHRKKLIFKFLMAQPFYNDSLFYY
jgi:hypothetical protein